MESIFSKIIKSGDLCFDVGANVGSKTDILLQLDARIVCIEPQPSCVSILQKKYLGNPAVTIVPKGIGQAPGTLPLSVCEKGSIISTFSEKWKTGRFAGNKWESTIEVPITTLDALIDRYGVPAFIKIDVEGYEYQVLLGLTRPVPAVSFEFTAEFIDDCRKCVDQVCGLDNKVLFNYTVGESVGFENAKWVSAEDLMLMLEVKMMEDHELWGDVYSKSEI